MLTPDTKDWTWVLGRACPECGFDASHCAADSVAGLVRANAAAWHDLLLQGAVSPGRPDDATWSPLEYACHVRDVYRRYDDRIVRMLTEQDPLFQNWDQDASAVEERYGEQDPVTAVADLEANAATLARRLGGLSEADWQRPGRRSDGASFTVATIARYMIHDTVHHVWDVTARDRSANLSEL
ncbi:MAG: DinB family protein [Acidimicrobiales bacterium]